MRGIINRFGSAYRTRWDAVIVAVVFATVSWGSVQAADTNPQLDEIVEFTGQIVFLQQKVPALVIGVVRNDEFSVYGFGERAGEGSEAPDGNTLMRIGSITKAFTGEVLAHLVADNLIELTQPITRSWPELADGAKNDVGNIRLIDLVTHSAGLQRELPRTPGRENDPTATITIKAISDWLKNEPLLTAPGKSILYSNVGFDVLAHGLSRAASRPYPELLESYITSPLSLKNTVFKLSAEQEKRLMQGHGFDGAPLPNIPTGSVIVGSGGLYSTPNDLLNWMKWHLDRFSTSGMEPRLLDHALYLNRDGLDSVFGMDESGHMDAMGLGWVGMMPEGNRPFILQKAGGLQGVFSYIAFAPARGVGVFISINTYDFNAATAMAVAANELIATLAPR
ncbi:MAG: D-alanyl-D-alanine-carboxypeptidase/endopeptidase AmpH [Proteobacteria bacterium]|nr:D-alanyl-D-alanine-carboxypeptidase/endopeptidase AmpH [Pseudomonadota bacterium]